MYLKANGHKNNALHLTSRNVNTTSVSFMYYMLDAFDVHVLCDSGIPALSKHFGPLLGIHLRSGIRPGTR
jgi:hypothetical protein